MPDSDNKRVPCTKCRVMILPLTAQIYGGLCPGCRREETRATQEAVPATVIEPATPPVVMDIRVDDGAFDRQQLQLIREIVRAIKSDLAESGIPKDRLEDITGDVAFSIAAILDGSRVMQVEGQPLIPVLTFAEDAQRTKLVARPGGSFMHESVHGIVDEVFDDDAGESS